MEFGALFNTNPIFRLLTNCEMKNEFQMRPEWDNQFLYDN